MSDKLSALSLLLDAVRPTIPAALAPALVVIEQHATGLSDLTDVELHELWLAITLSDARTATSIARDGSGHAQRMRRKHKSIESSRRAARARAHHDSRRAA